MKLLYIFPLKTDSIRINLQFWTQFSYDESEYRLSLDAFHNSIGLKYSIVTKSLQKYFWKNCQMRKITIYYIFSSILIFNLVEIASLMLNLTSSLI